MILFPPGEEGAMSPSLSVFLGAFAAAKLVVLVAIQQFTSEANRNRWNEKAVDYRYLAERLRAMAYLPAAGSLRALRPGSVGPATRVGTQSVMDWLFQAMVRQPSLEEIVPPQGQPKRIPARAGRRRHRHSRRLDRKSGSLPRKECGRDAPDQRGV